MSEHKHEIVIIGMVNIVRDNYLQGIVDVWRCRQCKRLFCDDRRYGEQLKPSVGFDEIGDDEQWAILICTNIREVFMQSMGVKPGKKISHTCKSGRVQEFVVNSDWAIDAEEDMTIHRLFLVKDYVNKVIEAGYYNLKMLR